MGPPRSVHDSVATVRRMAVITAVGLCVLVVAGGVVRLTGSGLGCDDWPNCNSESFVDVSSGHTAIEQVNRLFSGVMGIPTLLLAISAFRTRRTEAKHLGLWWPSFGVLLTVLANGVVGGIAVRGDLHPALVQSHFLLAMLSIAFALVVIHRTRPDLRGVIAPSITALVRLLAVLTAGALVTGTVVTGTGPHAGEEDVRRFGFDISAVARVHSVTVIVAMIVATALVWRVRNDSSALTVVGPLMSGWIFVGLVQGAIGYVQYFNGIPELLVGTHIAAATLLWVLTVLLFLRVRTASLAARGESMTSAALADA